MILNLVSINTATTTSWATGDVNGPSMRWVDAPAVSGSWTKAADPEGAVMALASESRYIMLLATMYNASSAAHGEWHKETV